MEDQYEEYEDEKDDYYEEDGYYEEDEYADGTYNNEQYDEQGWVS